MFALTWQNSLSSLETRGTTTTVTITDDIINSGALKANCTSDSVKTILGIEVQKKQVLIQKLMLLITTPVLKSKQIFLRIKRNYFQHMITEKLLVHANGIKLKSNLRMEKNNFKGNSSNLFQRVTKWWI